MSHKKLEQVKVTCDFCEDEYFIVDLQPGKEYWYPFGWWLVTIQYVEGNELVEEQLESCRECYERHSDEWFKNKNLLREADGLCPFSAVTCRSPRTNEP